MVSHPYFVYDRNVKSTPHLPPSLGSRGAYAMNAEPGWTRQDLDTYLSDRYVSLDEVAEKTGLDRELLEVLVDTGCIPGPSYELRSREELYASINGGSDTVELRTVARYFAKDVIAWVESIAPRLRDSSPADLAPGPQVGAPCRVPRGPHRARRRLDRVRGVHDPGGSDRSRPVRHPLRRIHLAELAGRYLGDLRPRLGAHAERRAQRPLPSVASSGSPMTGRR